MLASVKRAIRKSINRLGYEVRKIDRPPTPVVPAPSTAPAPPSVEPVWPLPRRPGGPSDEEIRDQFAKFPLWQYIYEFQGSLSFPGNEIANNPKRPIDPKRPLQRFRHFIPDLVASQGGSLRGKRVLDIACNSGFWSFQCALLGAEVVGFDARDVLIEHANLIKSIVGLDNVSFRRLDFWSMSPESLGGVFDIVLNLGILYHLPDPLEVLRITRSMARDVIILDTEISPVPWPVIHLKWEEPVDIRDASNPGIVAHPSKTAMDLMLRHLGMREWFEIPIRTRDMPGDYLNGWRASWIIRP